VIPAMDRIATPLKPQMKRVIHPAIAAALNLVHKKLDHYYSLTDSLSLYQIAMGMWFIIDMI
jgi:hypothetical protein